MRRQGQAVVAVSAQEQLAIAAVVIAEGVGFEVGAGLVAGFAVRLAQGFGGVGVGIVVDGVLPGLFVLVFAAELPAAFAGAGPGRCEAQDALAGPEWAVELLVLGGPLQVLPS